MKLFNAPIAIAGLFLTTLTLAHAHDEASREAAVRAADTARFAAVVNKDVEALQGLLADELVYCHSGGMCEGKDRYIANIKAGRLRYQSLTAEKSSVILLRDVAVINGTATAVVASGNDPLQRVALGYTDVFVWRDGRWQLITWRSVALPK